MIFLGTPPELRKRWKKRFAVFCISSLLWIHIDDFAILVDRPPKVALLAINLYEHFIQKVGITESRVPVPETSSEFRTEFVDPKSYGFLADGNIVLNQQVLDISNAEIEAVVEPHGILDDRRRESMSFVDVLHLDMLPEGSLDCQCRFRDSPVAGRLCSAPGETRSPVIIK